MGYLSIEFLILVIVSVLIYWIFPQNMRWTILLGASTIFYLSYNVKFFLCFVITIFTTFITAIWITRNKVHSKLILGLCIIVNICIWFMVKSYNWYGTLLNNLLGLDDVAWQIPIIDILVPLGISYYVLTTISYIVDVYYGKVQPEKNLFKYMLYVMWFPAIVQGPIMRYSQLAPQLFENHIFKYETFCHELQLILFGLVKKVVIADQIAVVVNYCFEYYTDLYGFTLYVGAVAYALQLYMDFSGCVDICRGVSGLFGIELVNNFNAPYFSKSIKEFWQRWHISLSSWLRDYIYIPLGGNRKGVVCQYINLAITFLVSGIWHGTGFMFWAWGGIHAIYQIWGDIYRRTGVQKSIKKIFGIAENSFSDQVFKTIITFHLVTFAWIFFRSESVTDAIQYIGNMMSSFNIWVLYDGSLFTYGIDYRTFVILCVNIAAVFFVDFLHIKKGIKIREAISSCHICLRWFVYMLLIYDVVIFGAYGSGFDVSAFLYGGF